MLLFEPGFGMLPFFYTTLIEDLVSHGYIVAGIIPTYYTHYNVFSNSRVVDTFISAHTNARLPDWTGDMIFTLNQLEKVNADSESQFHERLDFMRVGAFGHSFGGAASAQVAKDETRVRAALDLDGTLVPALLTALSTAASRSLFLCLIILILAKAIIIGCRCFSRC